MPSIRNITLQFPPARPGERVTSGAGRPSGPAEDALRITAFAEALQAIESGSSDDRMVNLGKVVDVQQALARGSYEFNADRTALKFINFELMLYGGQG